MNDSVKSATRVLDLLELFSIVEEPLGVSDIAKRLEFPKSSTQALLLTLLARGYLVNSGDGYKLSPHVRGGWVGGPRSRLIGVAEPIMKRMTLESGESAFIGVLTAAGKVQYVAKSVSTKEVRYDASLEHTRPVHCTSIGLVILAHMDLERAERLLKPATLVSVTPYTETDPKKISQALLKARRDGYAEVRDGNVEGASGVSAPIFDSKGEVIAGLNLGAPTSRYKSSREKLIDIVCRSAASLSIALGASVDAARTPS